MARDVGRRRDPLRISSCGALVVAALCSFGGASCVGQLGDIEGGEPPTGTPSGEDPGRVTMHRLNRAEYDNTVSHLLGTTLRPAVDFPADDHAYGFDNMADTLTMSPLQLELYERAAETLAEDVLRLASESALERHEAETVGGSVGAASGSAWVLTSNGDVTVTQAISGAGTYRVRVRAWQQAAGPDPARMSIDFGGTTFGPLDVTGGSGSPQTFEQEVQLDGTSATAVVSFLNDYYMPDAGADRNLAVDWIEIEGPIDAVAANPLRDRIVTCDVATEGETCLREIIETFGRRAYRRPLTPAEVDGYVALYEIAIAQGDSENAGLELVVRAFLSSAHFVFRVEVDEDPTSEKAHPLSAYELASRLSYFIWSSMPDDTLLDLAESGELLDEEVLRQQVDRMLDDPRSVALVDNFAGQWLFIRALADRTPDYAAFPDFDEDLRESMKVEANRFFSEFLAADGPPLEDLILADFSYVDDRLATHYGLEGEFGAEPARVSVGGTTRGGLLRQGAWLTVTSNPDRTSPVKRGKWILENLLCDAPPPPPAGVEGFKPGDLEAKTQRELLEQHRADPACAACHAVMDPLGLALENYDGIGAWRTEDKGEPVDASGEVEAGTFQTPDQFITLLVEDERLSQCAVEKVFTYALGRAPGSDDRPYLSEIDDAFVADGSSLRELMKLVVTSEPFRYRRGEAEGGTP